MAMVWKFEARVQQDDGRSSSKTCFVAIADLRAALEALEKDQKVTGTNPGELLSEEEVAATLGYPLKEGAIVCL